MNWNTGRWVCSSEKVLLKTQRQKYIYISIYIIPDQVRSVLRPQSPFTKAGKNKALTQKHTLHSWRLWTLTHTFTELWPRAPTPLTYRTHRHTRRSDPSGPVDSADLFHQIFYHTKRQILCFYRPNVKWYDHFFFFFFNYWLEADMKSVSGSAAFTLYNHLVHCSRFPENICSTQKKKLKATPNIYYIWQNCTIIQGGQRSIGQRGEWVKTPDFDQFKPGSLTEVGWKSEQKAWSSHIL